MEFFDIIKLVLFIVTAAMIGFFLRINITYRKNVLKILGDILMVYKNFFHWNISKIVLNAYSWLLGLIVSSPLLALSVFLLFKTSEALGSENIQLLSLVVSSGDIGAILRTFANFGTKGIWFLSSMVGVISIIMIIIFAFMYSYLLLQNIYRNYLVGKKLSVSRWSSVSALVFAISSMLLSVAFGDNPYLFIGGIIGAGILLSPFFIFGILKSENLFLDYRLIWKFLGVSCWTVLYLLVPSALLLIILFIPQYQPVQSLIDSKDLTTLSIYVISFFAIFIYFIYMCIRLIFTNLTLLDDSKNLSRPAKDYVKKSLSMTKNKVLHLTALSLPFFMISMLLTELTGFLDGFNGYMPLFTRLFDFLFISGIGFMILNSLYELSKADKDVDFIIPQAEDNALTEIELKPAKKEIKPIIGSPSAGVKKPAPKKAPAKKMKPTSI